MSRLPTVENALSGQASRMTASWKRMLTYSLGTAWVTVHFSYGHYRGGGMGDGVRFAHGSGFTTSQSATTMEVPQHIMERLPVARLLLMESTYSLHWSLHW